MENEGTEPKELESDKMLAQINAMKTGKTPPAQAVKEPIESKPKEPEPTQLDKAPKPTVEIEPAPIGKAEETKTPTDKKEGKSEVDIREWAKRKGIKENDTDSVLKAYREAERKISQLSAEVKKTEDVPRGTNPQQNYQMPAWQPQPQYNPYYPPPPPQYADRRAILESEAARFNMLPEELEKFLPLVNEVAGIQTRRVAEAMQSRYDSQLAELNRGNKRNAEFNELMADPLFTKPEVAFEIDQLMAENPQRLKLEPTPWTNMFKDALERIARRNLNGTVPIEESSQTPNSPPKSGGHGTTPGIPPTNSPGTVIDKFKRLNAKEMEEQLTSLGALKPQSGVSFE